MTASITALSTITGQFIASVRPAAGPRLALAPSKPRTSFLSVLLSALATWPC